MADDNDEEEERPEAPVGYRYSRKGNLVPTDPGIFDPARFLSSLDTGKGGYLLGGRTLDATQAAAEGWRQHQKQYGNSASVASGQQVPTAAELPSSRGAPVFQPKAGSRAAEKEARDRYGAPPVRPSPQRPRTETAPPASNAAPPGGRPSSRRFPPYAGRQETKVPYGISPYGQRAGRRLPPFSGYLSQDEGDEGQYGGYGGPGRYPKRSRTQGLPPGAFPPYAGSQPRQWRPMGGYEEEGGFTGQGFPGGPGRYGRGLAFEEPAPVPRRRPWGFGGGGVFEDPLPGPRGDYGRSRYGPPPLEGFGDYGGEQGFGDEGGGTPPVQVQRPPQAPRRFNVTEATRLLRAGHPDLARRVQQQVVGGFAADANLGNEIDAALGGGAPSAQATSVGQGIAKPQRSPGVFGGYEERGGYTGQGNQGRGYGSRRYGLPPLATQEEDPYGGMIPGLQSVFRGQQQRAAQTPLPWLSGQANTRLLPSERRILGAEAQSRGIDPEDYFEQSRRLSQTGAPPRQYNRARRPF